MPEVTHGIFYTQGRFAAGGTLGGISLLMIGIGYWLYTSNDPRFRESGTTIGILNIGIGVLLLALVPVALYIRFVLLPDRLRKESSFGNKEIRFLDMQVVELNSRPENSRRYGSGGEWIKISGGGTTLLLASTVEEYAQVRDHILKQATNARVTDNRQFRV